METQVFQKKNLTEVGIWSRAYTYGSGLGSFRFGFVNYNFGFAFQKPVAFNSVPFRPRVSTRRRPLDARLGRSESPRW